MDAIIILHDDTILHTVILDTRPTDEELSEMVDYFDGNRYIVSSYDIAPDAGSLKSSYGDYVD